MERQISGAAAKLAVRGFLVVQSDGEAARAVEEGLAVRPQARRAQGHGAVARAERTQNAARALAQRAGLRARLEMASGFRGAMHDVDHREERRAPVLHRARSAHHLDALHVGEVGVEVVADVALAERRLVGDVAIGEHQHAAVVDAGAGEPAHA